MATEIIYKYEEKKEEITQNEEKMIGLEPYGTNWINWPGQLEKSDYSGVYNITVNNVKFLANFAVEKGVGRVDILTPEFKGLARIKIIINNGKNIANIARACIERVMTFEQHHEYLRYVQIIHDNVMKMDIATFKVAREYMLAYEVEKVDVEMPEILKNGAFSKFDEPFMMIVARPGC